MQVEGCVEPCGWQVQSSALQHAEGDINNACPKFGACLHITTGADPMLLLSISICLFALLLSLLPCLFGAALASIICTFIERKKVVLGTKPILLSAFSTGGQRHIFAASDRPTIIYSNNKKLLYSNLNENEVSAPGLALARNGFFGCH